MEAETIKLFHKLAPLVHLCNKSGVQVPRFVCHYVKESVLVTRHRGSLVTLCSVLSPKVLERSDLADNRLVEISSAVGKAVGKFFARLHSSDTVARVRSAYNSEPNLASSNPELTQTPTHHYLSNTKVKSIRESLTAIANDSDELYQRILDAYHQPAPPNCLSHGNCRTESIMLPDWSVLDNEVDKPTVLVFDWGSLETTGRGVDGDIAQLLASLHCHYLYLEALDDSKLDDSERTCKVLGPLRAMVCTGCFLEGLVTSYSEFSSDMHEPDVKAKLLRSTVILVGCETIIQAYEVAWDLKDYAVSVDEVRKRMVMAGADYLRKAGKDDMEALNTFSGVDNYISDLFSLHKQS